MTRPRLTTRLRRFATHRHTLAVLSATATVAGIVGPRHDVKWLGTAGLILTAYVGWAQHACRKPNRTSAPPCPEKLDRP